MYFPRARRGACIRGRCSLFATGHARDHSFTRSVSKSLRGRYSSTKKESRPPIASNSVFVPRSIMSSNSRRTRALTYGLVGPTPGEPAREPGSIRHQRGRRDGSDFHGQGRRTLVQHETRGLAPTNQSPRPSTSTLAEEMRRGTRSPSYERNPPSFSLTPGLRRPGVQKPRWTRNQVDLESAILDPSRKPTGRFDRSTMGRQRPSRSRSSLYATRTSIGTVNAVVHHRIAPGSLWAIAYVTSPRIRRK